MATEELAELPGLAGLYAKAAAGLVPGRQPAGTTLPDTELVVRQVAVDRSRLAGYVRVCGFRLTDALPPTYPHILAFPLALRLMTDPDFPFPAAGVVHLANRIAVRRPVTAGERLDLAVHAEALRPHDRGQQLDLVAVATVDGHEVWRGVSTYLHRTGSGSGSRGGHPDPPEPSSVWRVGAEVGRAYAAVSGDRNPIHTSTLAARAFGFRRRIAHGMWTKARCLAQLAPRLPEAYAVAVTFQAPILLPATVSFSASPGAFAVHDRRTGRPHLSGTIDPGPGTR